MKHHLQGLYVLRTNIRIYCNFIFSSTSVYGGCSVTVQLRILMIMTPYCEINTMKYLSGNHETGTSVASITSYLFCLSTDAPQHERLPAATNDPPLFFSGEMINCKIAVTFLFLISWFAASRCAPNIMEESVQFVMGGDCRKQVGVMWGLVCSEWSFESICCWCSLYGNDSSTTC